VRGGSRPRPPITAPRSAWPPRSPASSLETSRPPPSLQPDFRPHIDAPQPRTGYSTPSSAPARPAQPRPASPPRGPPRTTKSKAPSRPSRRRQPLFVFRRPSPSVKSSATHRNDHAPPHLGGHRLTHRPANYCATRRGWPVCRSTVPPCTVRRAPTQMPRVIGLDPTATKPIRLFSGPRPASAVKHPWARPLRPAPNGAGLHPPAGLQRHPGPTHRNPLPTSVEPLAARKNPSGGAPTQEPPRVCHLQTPPPSRAVTLRPPTKPGTDSRQWERGRPRVRSPFTKEAVPPPRNDVSYRCPSSSAPYGAVAGHPPYITGPASQHRPPGPCADAAAWAYPPRQKTPGGPQPQPRAFPGNRPGFLTAYPQRRPARLAATRSNPPPTFAPGFAALPGPTPNNTAARTLTQLRAHHKAVPRPKPCHQTATQVARALAPSTPSRPHIRAATGEDLPYPITLTSAAADGTVAAVDFRAALHRRTKTTPNSTPPVLARPPPSADRF